jgi:membrane-associated phospholipid phosphatase
VNLSNGREIPEEKAPSFWVRLFRLLKSYRPVAWLVFLITSLALFLAWMPSGIRFVIWKALTSRGILSSMLVVFSLLALSLLWSSGQRFDVWAFLFFNQWGFRPIWLDRLMLGFTQLGSGIFAVAIGLVMFLNGDRLGAYELILGTLTLWIVVELIKALTQRSRPSFHITQARIVGSLPIGRSFPSGHTSQSFFTVTLIAQHFEAGAWVVFLLYALALLVGITRMYVGAHYPRDVLAGAILGSAWGLLGALVDQYIQ